MNNTTQQPNFLISFSRTTSGITSTVTAFSTAITYKGAILDARTQAHRADNISGEIATYGDFEATPARRVL